jgi:hypothetical protein
MSDGGKGDKPRPILIDKEEYKERWDTIFGEKPILTGYCDKCNKKFSWCECDVNVNKEEKEILVKKTWEF